MENLEFYNKFRSVPKDAQKEIGAGRLKGFTDINPMWRIKILTETFGPCGIGWYTEIINKWSENTVNEIAVFVEINLYIKIENEWSKPIYGIGGSKLLMQESKGPYTSDEAYKMAYTDAISIACKALGVGADIYYSKDRTKYSSEETEIRDSSEETEIRDSSEETEIRDSSIILAAISEINNSTTLAQITKIWNDNKKYDASKALALAITRRRKELGI